MKEQMTLRSINGRTALKESEKCGLIVNKNETKIMVTDRARSLPQTYCLSAQEWRNLSSWVLLSEMMVAQQKIYGRELH